MGDELKSVWRKWFQWGVLILIGVISLPLFRYMFDCMRAKFRDPREDMSHGWFVPIACAAFIWTQRKELCKAAGAPSWRGFGFVCAGLVVFWLGNNGEQYRLCQAAFSLLLWAVPYALWGKRVARLMAFPAAFFLFTIPIAFLDFFTIRLRMLAAAVATGLLNGVGLTVTRIGTALHSTVGSGFSLDVADPCSGLRSLFAMTALTTAYAYYTQKTPAGKWLLFFSAVPIAVIGNICRIASICVAAWLFGQEAASGYYHDYSGYVVFLVGVALMMQAGHVLDRLPLDTFCAGRSAVAEGPPARAAGEARARGPAVATAVAFLLVLVLKSQTGQPLYERDDFVAAVLPGRVGEFVGDKPWYCQNEQCMQMILESELARRGKPGDGGFVCPECKGPMGEMAMGEQKLLVGETRLLKCTYRAADGLLYSINVVVAGRAHSTIHRPELCLPTQGFSMEKAETVQLKVAGMRPLEARKLTLRIGQSPAFSQVYWFSKRTYQTSSHTKRLLSNIWDRSVFNRVSCWFMVSVQLSSPLDSEEARARFERFLSEWYPQVYLETSKAGGSPEKTKDD